jgi:hypothetical protein
MSYDPNQPRDWHGRWTDEGGGGGLPPPPEKPYAATYMEWAAYFDAKKQYDAMVAQQAQASGQAPGVQLAESSMIRLVQPGDPDYPKNPPPPPVLEPQPEKTDAHNQPAVNLPPVNLPGIYWPPPPPPPEPAPQAPPQKPVPQWVQKRLEREQALQNRSFWDWLKNPWNRDSDRQTFIGVRR